MKLRLASIADAIQCANLHVVRLFMMNRRLVPQYCSAALRCYDELLTRGLPARNPLEFMYEHAWAPRHIDERIDLPIGIHTGGGTRLDELVMLAMVARVLRPSKVFEFGTYMGRTTSVLRLNVPPSASVVTLDLPPGADSATTAGCGIDTDARLIERREVGVLLRQLHLDDQCEQIFCDSLAFDPAPHRGSVELGFIDGAHSRRHVENDTQKMATMVASRGLVFWHDYGGKGRFRDLTNYLDGLSKRIAIYRVPRMTLAWATAQELRKIAVDRDSTLVAT
jgi:predicted O-methyltransferase YrrM